MKQLANFITKTTEKIKNNFWLRVLYYTGVLIFVLLIFLLLKTKEIAFVYNEF